MAAVGSAHTWGRWGADDEKGTVNLISPEKIRQAAALVRDGRSISISRPFPTEPGPANPRPAAQALMREARAGGAGASLEYLGIAYHGVSCTHVDALCHCWGPDGMWGGRNPDAVLDPTGSSWGSIDHWRHGIITRGVLLDVPAFRGTPCVEPDRPVQPGELDAIAEAQGVMPDSGDAVLIYCGRDAWDASHPAWGSERSRPGLHSSCLDFLKRRDVAVLGWDMMDAVPNEEGQAFGVHAAIYRLGLALVDNCDLGELIAVCRQQDRWEFMFVVSPLRLIRGTGSPANPLAIL
jgi:kynurenine formamidase